MQAQLQDVASVRGGYHFRGSVQDQPEGDTPVIQAQDFLAADTGAFDGRTLRRIQAAFDPAPYLVERGDVLFLSRAHRNRASAIADAPPGMIAPGYFYIVRPDAARVDAGFLAWWLNHPSTHRALREMRRGTNIPFIALGDFRAIQIPTPPLGTQRAIVRAGDLRTRERVLATQLHEARDLLLDTITLRAASARAAKD